MQAKMTDFYQISLVALKRAFTMVLIEKGPFDSKINGENILNTAYTKTDVVFF